MAFDNQQGLICHKTQPTIFIPMIDLTNPLCNNQSNIFRSHFRQVIDCYIALCEDGEEALSCMKILFTCCLSKPKLKIALKKFLVSPKNYLLLHSNT